MENSEKVAVIGNIDNILVFKSVGCDVFAVDSEAKTRSALNKALQNYKVILISDDYAVFVEDIIKDSLLNTYPVVLIIPSGTNPSEYALNKISESVERALGVNILFDKEN